jgi:hypothetical protein
MLARVVCILFLAATALGAQGTPPDTTARRPGLSAPPALKQPFAAPAPVPDAVRGFRLQVEFVVREDGKPLEFQFRPTADKAFNRRLDSALKALAFKPATDSAGNAVRGRVALTYVF